jgi:hypothetical protein
MTDFFLIFKKKKIKINKKKKKRNERGEGRKRDTVGVFLGGKRILWVISSATTHSHRRVRLEYNCVAH